MSYVFSREEYERRVAWYTRARFGLFLHWGLYFSLLDWRHPDFPHYGDRNHPMRDDPACGNEGRDFGRYLAFMHAQVRELCSNYGKLDLLWFDFSYDDLRGEAWKATELVEMVRSLQPEVIIDNRLEVSGEGFGSLAACRPTPYHGDFVSPEQIVPPHGLRDAEGRPLVWESCVTMNNHWGYCAADRCYKPAPMLIKKLVECVSKGGNLLLNVGPDAQGRFPDRALEILRDMGKWMARNGESIYGCGPSGLDKPEYGRITRRGNTLYFHIFENTIGPLPLFGVDKTRIAALRLLADGSEVPVSSSWVHRPACIRRGSDEGAVLGGAAGGPVPGAPAGHGIPARPPARKRPGLLFLCAVPGVRGARPLSPGARPRLRGAGLGDLRPLRPLSPGE